ncbi:MAG: heme lyase CcmF/NrfE family subunit [Gemmatimonadetes bacterium]|nr:heme lyase CcmF/NrfE family subunit [Gemmatimonadota bacterium]
MIPALGEFALWIALPVALWGCALAFLGGAWSRGDLVLSAERCTYAIFFLVAVASAGIITAFVQDRYEYWYVYNYSSRELLTFFKIAGLWAGQRGSIVFWALNLSLFSSIAIWFNRDRNRDLMPYVNGVLLALLSFFIAISIFVQPPFELLGFTPADGRGLNPQLQNYWMTMHPPMLYLGFTSFSIPFAFAMAALMTGHLDARWFQVTRKWTLSSWLFLTVGVILGMRWAYEELGWGGYWFWDPVENASLLPWLVATAFLHSVMIQENRGMLKVWNMGLVILTFLMTIFATFLTRSGLIESVHSFAQNLTIAWIFLGCLGVVAAISTVLVVWRLPLMQSERQFESFVSREAAFLMNNLILLGIAFTVTWGVMFPLLTEGLTGSKVAVGPPFFNRVNIPMGLVLLALMGIGPVIAWRKATPRNLKRNFLFPIVVAGVVAAVLFEMGVRHAYALLTFVLGAFVLTIILIEFWKGTRARARIEAENPAIALVHLVRRNRQRWGGYIVHVGIVVIFMGFAGKAYDVEVRQSLMPGESMAVLSPFGHEYELTYESLSTSRPQNTFAVVTALFTVRQDGADLGPLTTERQFVLAPPQTMTEVGIRSTIVEDLYLLMVLNQDEVGIVENRPDLQRATFVAMVNPLVPWIWYGGLIVVVGSLIGLWPGAGLPIPRHGGERTESDGLAPGDGDSGSSEHDPASGAPAAVG